MREAFKNKSTLLHLLNLSIGLGVMLSAASMGCNHQKPSERDRAVSEQAAASAASDEEGQRTETSSSAVASSREATLARIGRLLSVGDLNGAQSLVQAYLLRHPEDPGAIALAAQIAAANGRIDEAVNLFDEAANRSAKQGKYWKTQAATLLAQAERWNEATDRLEGIVRAYPDFNQARHDLVAILNARGFRFDANEHVRELCLRNEATLDELRGLMVPARSHTGFTEKPDIQSREQIEKHGAMNVARALFSEGDVRDACEVMKRSRVVQEKHPAAIAFYGQVLMESQQFDAFAAWLESTGSQCRRYPAYWMAMGDWAMHQRKYDSAVRMFAEAVIREPGDLAASDHMAQVLAAAGRDDESERFRQRGVEIQSLILRTKELLKDPHGLKLVTEISQTLSQIGRPLESLAWYRIALREMGSPPDAMIKLDEAMAELSQEQFQQSLLRARLCGIDLDEFPLEISSVAKAATGPPQRPPGPERPAPMQPSFVNVAPMVGLRFQYRSAPVSVERELLIFQQLGGGIACLDYDLDGRVDFYMAQAAGDPPGGSGHQPNLLARNLGNRFRDVTERASCDDRGYSSGVTSGDWNQDGFPDSVVANIQRNTLFINQGDGTYRIQPGDSVWNDAMYTASLAMADVDGDQLPDLVEINYLDDPHIFDPMERNPDGTPVLLPGPMQFQAAVDRVFLSLGDGSFSGQRLGDPDQPTPATGLGVLVTDIDGNPGNEIFVANDRLANHLWERPEHVDGVVRWQNSAGVRGVAYGAKGTPMGCMGIAAADFDENGRIDLHITNFENEWSNQFMQDTDGFFQDLVVACGLAEPSYMMVGFGTQALDYDNNSVVDLVVGNGHIEDLTARGTEFEMPTQIFAAESSRFVPMQVEGDPSYWKAGHLSRGLATCDWNHDGRLDFLVTDLREPVALFENRTATPYHWLQLQLVGTVSERDAIGAAVTASFAGRTITKLVQAGDGYMSKNESLLHIGLGDHNRIDRLEIRWPDGGHQTFSDSCCRSAMVSCPGG